MTTSNDNPSSRRKLALIIGNDNYTQPYNRLKNSTKNAPDLTKLLKEINFDVTSACNLAKHEMITLIIDFSTTITDGDLVLFYFCGFGYNVNDENYLIPVGDSHIRNDQDFEDFAVNFKRSLMRLVRQNPSYATIFILDCSSPYLLENAPTTISAIERKGLRKIDPPIGAFIQFACNDNHTIVDDQETDQNRLFTKHLLKNLAKENVHIVEIFRQIVDDVQEESNYHQNPLSMNGLPEDWNVYLNEVAIPVVVETDLSEEEQIKWSIEPMGPEEKAYYKKCEKYFRIIGMPVISVSDSIFNDDDELDTVSLVFVIDEDHNNFDVQTFLSQIRNILKLPTLTVRTIQKGSVKVVAEIWKEFSSELKKIEIKALYNSLTDALLRALGQLKIIFMFMGNITELFDKQHFRYEIKLYPKYNRIYDFGHNHWIGPNNDGLDRGNSPYYCPVGWKRFSLYVTEDFYKKFKGWCICYHGTKFAHGLSILLNGLKPAGAAEHGEGIYTSPSIIYTSHPRYSEIKEIKSVNEKEFFRHGKYIQFALECRVNPNNIKSIDKETLGATDTIIDPNFNNGIIEWVIKSEGKQIMDFNDPNSTIVCTGLMIRVTDNHPGLLPDSKWWFQSHLCYNESCCRPGIDHHDLEKKRFNGEKCSTIYE